MAKKKKRERIVRVDPIKKFLPTFYQGTKHSAYLWMKRCKQGQLPHGNTNPGKALAAIELGLIEHFGDLNVPQQVQLNLLRPLLVFWMLHPITVEGGLAADFKWCHSRIENGLRVLCELADKKASDTDLYEKWRTEFFKDSIKSNKKAKNDRA